MARSYDNEILKLFMLQIYFSLVDGKIYNGSILFSSEYLVLGPEQMLHKYKLCK